MIYVECFDCHRLTPQESPDQMQCSKCGSANVQILSEAALNARDLAETPNGTTEG